MVIFQNEMGIFIGAHQIGWFELIYIDLTRDEEVEGLTGGSLNYRTVGLTIGVYIGSGSFFGVFFFET